jgi:hypothetical protein
MCESRHPGGFSIFTTQNHGYKSRHTGLSQQARRINDQQLRDTA